MKILIKNALLLDGIVYSLPTAKDILIEGNIISKIADSIESSVEGIRVIDVQGAIVSPGIMDLHVHSSDGFAKIGCMPDDIGMKLGVSAIFDAGTYGADTFDYFYENIIKKSVTRVYAWLNVSSEGLLTLSELQDMENIVEDKIIKVVDKYKDIIIGLKVRASASVVGENGINPIVEAKRIALNLGLPLMVHIGNPPPYVDDVLNLLSEGDVVTHCCHNKSESLFIGNEVRKSAIAAKERGVLFDIGHGNASFSFDVARNMIKNGFSPDFISTDIYNKNIVSPVKSQLYVASKLILCGLSLNECIVKITSKIAEKFNFKNMGMLKEGYIADLSIIRTIEGEYNIEDSVGKIEKCNMLLQPEGVIINGKYYQK